MQITCICQVTCYNRQVMLIDFLFSSLVVAGIAILWRALRMRHKIFARFFKKHLGFFSTAILCGFCFTYWTSFFFLLIFNPLSEWMPPMRHNLPDNIETIFHFLMSWMALSFAAVTLRFMFALLLEAVDHYTHNLHPRHGCKTNTCKH